MRPYVSIDIETTGLDPETCQILEIGAIIDDGKSLVKDLPRFHCYVTYKQIKGEPYALSMHPTILRRIATQEKGYRYLKPEHVGEDFREWLTENGIDDKVLAAGKNFGSFDLQFLNRLSEYGSPFKELVKFKRRFLDPAGMLYDPEVDLDGPPDSKTCMERCGRKGGVAHTALEDAEEVIHMIRFAQQQAHLSKALRGFFMVDEYDSRAETVVLVPLKDLHAAGRCAINAVALMNEIKDARR